MVVKYSSLNRMEKPKFTLCNPGSIYTDGLLSKVVGMLVDTEAEEIVFNFNATSELNLRINKVIREDAEENAHAYALYRAAQNRRLIFVEDIGYFMITGVEDGYDGHIHYKDISAKSVDVEIAQKMMPYIADGTYRFSTDETGENKGILETIVETLPLWTIARIDDAVANRWRTFEDVDTSLNCLSFMLQNIQDAFECIFVFDNIHRTISVYDQANYVHPTNIHITKDDLMNSLEVTENADDLYTAISVFGDDNITISAINPLGTNIIYDFTHYLDWMSDVLRTKVVAWQSDIEGKRDAYYDLNLQYYNKLTEISNLQMEIDKLDTQITMYSRCRDNIIAESSADIVPSYNEVIIENDGTEITIYEEIAETLAEIDNLIAVCTSTKENVQANMDAAQEEMGDIHNEILAIHNELAITQCFSEDEYAELSHYIFEGSYSDEYVTITDIMTYDEQFAQMKTLYDRAASQLQRVSRPTQEFSVDVENFIFIKDFEEWSEQLETGCLINVELDLNDVAALFLSNMTINYDDHSLSMTFGNRFNKFDPKSLYEDVLGQISKSANTLSYVKEILYPIKNGEFDSVKEALQTSRNLTMGQALASSNEEVIIDGSGYTGRRKRKDGTYDPRQVKLTGKNMVYTDDAWESCKVAIGELQFGDGNSAYGISAEAIIGDIVIGKNLRILDSNGRDLFTVVDGKIESSVKGVADNIETLTNVIQGTDGIVGIVTRVETLEGTEITEIKTTNGYTFNSKGLTIWAEGNSIQNLLDNAGMEVSRVVGNTTESILEANDDGVNALNLNARQFLIVGDKSGQSRFESYSGAAGTVRTACFFIPAADSNAIPE